MSYNFLGEAQNAQRALSDLNDYAYKAEHAIAQWAAQNEELKSRLTDVRQEAA